jgi:5'(3')-deoxyribonucleotidase
MRIVIDLDSVVLSLVPEFLEIYNERHGTSFITEDIIDWNISSIIGCDKSEMYKIFSQVRLEDRMIYDGAVSGCFALWNLFKSPILTATVHDLEELRVYLEKKAIRNDIIYTKSTKEKPKFNFDVFIDDYPYMYKYLREDQVQILYDQPWNRHIQHFNVEFWFFFC